jgi:hypothetical protein
MPAISPFLPAGPSSRPAHRFTYTDTEGVEQHVCVEQTEPSAEGSDRFGFRLMVDGQRFLIRRVEVLCDLHQNEEGGPWTLYRQTVGDDGINAYLLMFNTRVLLPTELASEVLVEEVGGELAEWSSADMVALERSQVFDNSGHGHTGFVVAGDDEYGGDDRFVFCTVAVGRDRITKQVQFNVFVFRIFIAPWPRAELYEERMGLAPRRQRATPPAGPFSHIEFVIQEGRRMVTVRQSFGRSSQFGFDLLIDGAEQAVRRVDVCLLECDPGASAAKLYEYTPGPNGADAFRLMFNSELLRPGDEARVLDALVPEPRRRLTRGSAIILATVRAGRYVRSMTGFDCQEATSDGAVAGTKTFSFCTCCAFPAAAGGELEFGLLVFEVVYGG